MIAFPQSCSDFHELLSGGQEWTWQSRCELPSGRAWTLKYYNIICIPAGKCIPNIAAFSYHYFFFFSVMDFECLSGQDKEQAAMKMQPWTQLP